MMCNHAVQASPDFNPEAAAALDYLIHARRMTVTDAVTAALDLYAAQTFGTRADLLPMPPLAEPLPNGGIVESALVYCARWHQWLEECYAQVNTHRERGQTAGEVCDAGGS